jgi:hypothetical protein
LPRLRTSCNGAIASAAGDDHANFIKAAATSPLSPVGRPQVLFLLIRQFLEPAAGGRIIVRASIYDSIGHKVARQVRIVTLAIESKLEHAHSRQLEAVAQRMHIARDQPQILLPAAKLPQAVSRSRRLKGITTA